MRRIPVLLILFLLQLSVGCTEEPPVPAVSEKALVPSAFTFVAKKTEATGLRNEMKLYALNKEFNAGDFRTFCATQKAEATAQAFTYVVLFDDAKNADFPDTPFTAMFGVEEGKMKHIIAVFEYNRMNGFCEMTTYDPNMWEGNPVIEKL